MKYFWIILSTVICVALYYLNKKYQPGKKHYDYSNSYKPRRFLSAHEKEAYKMIKEVTDQNGLFLFSKVRLLDLIEPKDSKKKYNGALWKIQAKHVDFVICDSELESHIIIELDDSSHDRQVRKERDTFVDSVLTKAGYKVLRMRTVNKSELDTLIGAGAAGDVFK